MLAKQVPRLFLPLVERLVRRQMRSHLFERGIARHAPADIERFGRDDIDALVGWLGDRSWFLGDRPTKVDASAFGLLAATIRSPLATPVHQYARSQPTLVRFVDRA